MACTCRSLRCFPKHNHIYSRSCILQAWLQLIPNLRRSKEHDRTDVDGPKTYMSLIMQHKRHGYCSHTLHSSTKALFQVPPL